MKRIKVLTLVVFFMAPIFIYGQMSENIRFGFQVNPHLSWMQTDNKNIAQSDFNTGVTVGTIAEYYLNETYAITTGIGLSFLQGGSLKYKYGGMLWSDAELSELKQQTKIPVDQSPMN